MISVALCLLESTTNPDGFHGKLFQTLRKRHMGSSAPLSVSLHEISNTLVAKHKRGKQHKTTVDLMTIDTKVLSRKSRTSVCRLGMQLSCQGACRESMEM